MPRGRDSVAICRAAVLRSSRPTASAARRCLSPFLLLRPCSPPPRRSRPSVSLCLVAPPPAHASFSGRAPPRSAPRCTTPASSGEHARDARMRARALRSACSWRVLFAGPFLPLLPGLLPEPRQGRAGPSLSPSSVRRFFASFFPFAPGVRVRAPVAPPTPTGRRAALTPLPPSSSGRLALLLLTFSNRHFGAALSLHRSRPVCLGSPLSRPAASDPFPATLPTPPAPFQPLARAEPSRNPSVPAVPTPPPFMPSLPPPPPTV